MLTAQIKLTEFSELIDSYTTGFVGREWLVKQVDALLADPSCHFVILTGSAGVGKSAFMAHLAATYPQWPRYFIRRDSREHLRPGDGKTFFLTIGGQLATIQPNLFKPEKLEIVVRQRIGDLEISGEAIGVRIEELRASPFYSVSILAEQEIQRVGGKATVVEIGRLVTEPRLLTLHDLQYLGLLDPAWLLYRTDPNARIVILVESLDELRFRPAEIDILEALSQLPEIPPNLRFIITSRREKFLDKLLGRSDVQELRLNVLAEENLKDLHTYAVANLPVNGLEPALAQEHRTRDRFIDDLLNKAAGNFLYLQSVLDGIKEALANPMKRERLQSLLRVTELPDELDALYDYFLDSIVNWVQRSGIGEAAWRKYLRPLLGVLAVARQPLNEVQLQAFTGLPSEDVGDLLRQLRQFVEMLDGPETYHIYHTSFADYLLDAKSNKEYRIDGSAWHERIADFYWNEYHDDWSKLADPYGVANLLDHMFVLTEQSNEQVRQSATQRLVSLLLKRRFLKARVARLGLYPMQYDLQRARNLAIGRWDRFRLLRAEQRLVMDVFDSFWFPSQYHEPDFMDAKDSWAVWPRPEGNPDGVSQVTAKNGIIYMRQEAQVLASPHTVLDSFRQALARHVLTSEEPGRRLVYEIPNFPGRVRTELIVTAIEGGRSLVVQQHMWWWTRPRSRFVAAISSRVLRFVVGVPTWRYFDEWANAFAAQVRQYSPSLRELEKIWKIEKLANGFLNLIKFLFAIQFFAFILGMILFGRSTDSLGNVVKLLGLLIVIAIVVAGTANIAKVLIQRLMPGRYIRGAEPLKIWAGYSNIFLVVMIWLFIIYYFYIMKLLA